MFRITLLSENPTVSKLTRVIDERKTRTKDVRKSLRNGKGAEKERKSLLYCVCTKPYDGRDTGASGHQLAVVAYRDCQLYCVCNKP